MQASVSRPSQVTGQFMAELRYTALLGGDVERIGPMSSLELRRVIETRKASLPGDHQPSVRMWEVPRS